MRYPANHGAESNGITTASEARKAGVISLIIKRREGTASVADKVGALVSREWDNHEVIQVPAGQGGRHQGASGDYRWCGLGGGRQCRHPTGATTGDRYGGGPGYPDPLCIVI